MNNLFLLIFKKRRLFFAHPTESSKLKRKHPSEDKKTDKYLFNFASLLRDGRRILMLYPSFNLINETIAFIIY